MSNSRQNAHNAVRESFFMKNSAKAAHLKQQKAQFKGLMQMLKEAQEKKDAAQPEEVEQISAEETEVVD